MSTQQTVSTELRSGCTLAELRQLVADTADLPAGSYVTGRTGFGAAAPGVRGTRITRLIVTTPTESPQ